ncbi:hypothetical protein [Kutzneria sp. NPDC052558]|uniref:hypothetical protein n=1 Tax=Kutzneria sp. NPDC052558 TaxID=3364121 RepID=UPI0037C67D90
MTRPVATAGFGPAHHGAGSAATDELSSRTDDQVLAARAQSCFAGRPRLDQSPEAAPVSHSNRPSLFSAKENSMKSLSTRVTGWNRPMLTLAAVMVVMAAASAVGLVFDQRELLGAPIWLKPFKFAISIAIYSVTWSWLFSLLRAPVRLARNTSTVIVLMMYVEYALIVAQVVRGRASHFNFTSAFDGLVYSIMGVCTAALWTGTLVLTILVLRAPIADAATRSALRLGSVISLIGIGLGALMVVPTPGQLDAMENGTSTGVIGAHSVGIDDSLSNAMPILGWNTAGGDLRIPHFVGMHALQVLPVVALVLSLLGSAVPLLRSPAVRARLVSTAAAGYLGLTLVVAWQAERGQALVHPDALTLSVVGVLVLGVALGCVVSVLRPAGPKADAAQAPRPSHTHQ